MLPNDTAAVDFLRRWESSAIKTAPKIKLLWPKILPEQVQAVRAAFASATAPLTAETIARTFQRARADKVGEPLETLAALGQVREVEPGSFVVEGRIACALNEAPPRPYDNVTTPCTVRPER